MFKVPEQYRLTRGPMATSAADGNNGAFFVPTRPGHPPLKIIASDGTGMPEMPEAQWEHVSVSLPHRCPTWEEMCRVKAMFWSDDDCVMQLHPPQVDWISNHPYCLHLWRPVGVEIPRPAGWLVGDKTLGALA